MLPGVSGQPLYLREAAAIARHAAVTNNAAVARHTVIVGLAAIVWHAAIAKCAAVARHVAIAMLASVARHAAIARRAYATRGMNHATHSPRVRYPPRSLCCAKVACPTGPPVNVGQECYAFAFGLLHWAPPFGAGGTH